MRPKLLSFLRRMVLSDARTVNKLFVSAFIECNNISSPQSSFLSKYVILTGSKEYGVFQEVCKRIISEYGTGISLETLVQLFEYVISPADRIVTGAIYTSHYVRTYILIKTIGDKDKESLRRLRIADMSCGCGGFLMDAALWIHQQTGKMYSEIFRDNIYGIDIEDYAVERTKILLSLLALTEGEDADFEFNLLSQDTLDYKSERWNKHFTGFDIIVGNPPYVCSRNMNEETRSKAFSYEVCKYGHPDLYIPFIQIAIESLNESGRLGFITMNSFFNSLNGRGLREYLVNKRLETRIIDFRDYQVFRSKSTYTCLLFISNTNAENVDYALADDGNLNADIHFEQIPYATLDSFRGWNLRAGDSAILENTGIPLGKYCSSRHGIATLSNKTYIFTPQAENEHFYVLEKDGICYQIEREICRDIVNSNKLNSEADFDFLVEKVIFPYRIDEDGKAVVYSEEEITDKFPMALAYLRSQREILHKRDKGHTENYPAWYAFGRTQSLVMPRFKLFFPKIANKPLQCVLVDDPQLMLYNGMAFVSDNREQLELLKCLLESDVFWEYVKQNARPYASGYSSLNGVNIMKFGVPEMKSAQVQYLLSEADKDKREKKIRSLYHIL